VTRFFLVGVPFFREKKTETRQHTHTTPNVFTIMRQKTEKKGLKMTCDKRQGNKRGFTIKCRDGKLAVNRADAKTLRERCYYFRDVFVHSPKEIEKCCTMKIGWDIATAKYLIKLILSKSTIVEDMTTLQKVLDAADQVLLSNVRVGTSFNTSYKDAMDQEMFMSYACSLPNDNNAGTFIFETTAYTAQKLSVVSCLWRTLADKGIFVCSEDGYWSIHHDHKRTVFSENRDELSDVFTSFLRSIDESSLDFGGRVALKITTDDSKLSIGQCINSIRSIIAINIASSEERMISGEEFSLRLCLDGGTLNDRIVNKIRKATGAHGYADSKSASSYYLRKGGDVSFGVFKFFGTFDKLQKVLQYVHAVFLDQKDPFCRARFNTSQCSLRVCNPTEENLHHVIRATLACQENPGTIGMNIKSNSYYAVKTSSDMTMMLNTLVSKTVSHSYSIAKNVKVVELTHPIGVF